MSHGDTRPATDGQRRAGELSSAPRKDRGLLRGEVRVGIRWQDLDRSTQTGQPTGYRRRPNGRWSSLRQRQRKGQERRQEQRKGERFVGEGKRQIREGRLRQRSKERNWKGCKRQRHRNKPGTARRADPRLLLQLWKVGASRTLLLVNKTSGFCGCRQFGIGPICKSDGIILFE